MIAALALRGSTANALPQTVAAKNDPPCDSGGAEHACNLNEYLVTAVDRN
jgi:hypothetical protein